jgi:hypothetical protein
MQMTKNSYDWTKSCDGKAAEKEEFHKQARRLLKALAKDMDFKAGAFDLRSNKAGSAVSGEITLHHDHVYIQASNPGARQERGLMIRTCENRQDYHGGRNHFAPLAWLDDENRPKLVKLVEQVMEQKLGFNADVKTDPGYNPHVSTPTYSR